MPYHLACKSWENTPIKWNSSTTGWWETRLNDFSHYYSARHKIAFLGYHLVNFLCPKNKEYSNKPLNYVRFESKIKQIKRFFCWKDKMSHDSLRLPFWSSEEFRYAIILSRWYAIVLTPKMLINLNTYGSKTPPLLQICWIGVSFVSLKVLEHTVENCMMHEREQKQTQSKAEIWSLVSIACSRVTRRCSGKDFSGLTYFSFFHDWRTF